MPRRTRLAGETNSVLSPKRRRRVINRNEFESYRAERDKALGGSDQPGRRINLSDAEFIDRYIALKSLETKTEFDLKADAIDLCVDKNRSAHKTDEYETTELVVRRGQVFTMIVTFNRPYDKEKDKVILQLLFGSRPMESKGTNLRVEMQQADLDKGNWGVRFLKAKGNTVKMAVMPDVDAAVGRYQIHVESLTTDGDHSDVNRQIFEETFIVLFNAWCEEDDVYMPDEDGRKEYVLNDHGRIWVGTRHDNKGIPWNFGQFEESVLEAALYVLNKAELSDGARSNVIHVCRTISAVANSNDDRGILTGRWGNEYPKPSTPPTAWIGSVAIIEQYMEKKQPVEFGQCWVFSGLVTTLLRALGIPTRSVTNFESAHDCDGSITIDYHWNEDHEPETKYNDSVWNFHVWNESFFRRQDLPEGYDGWQAFDATPQEASEGVMRCGPAPVKAIKEGNVYLPYDAPFIFAEVNGDKVHWLVKKDGSMEVLSKEHYAIGHSISTKSVGSNERQDLTSDYKHNEGSEEERNAVRRAFRYSSRRKYKVYETSDPDVTFTLELPESVTIGDDFTLKVTLKNTTQEVRSAEVRLTGISSFYTGVPSDRVGTKTFSEVLQAAEVKTCELKITRDAYQDLIKPESIVTVYMKGYILETKQAYAQTQSFHMLKPRLDLEAPEEVELGKSFSVKISFTNPLDVKLTGVTLHIEAYALTKSRVINIRKAVGPKEMFEHTIDDMLATRAGYREIMVNFSSNQLSGLTGVAEVRVKFGSS